MNSSRFLPLKWKWSNKLLESETTVLFVLPSPILASLYSCSTLYVGYVKALLVKNSAAFWNLIQNSCGCGICSPRVRVSCLLIRRVVVPFSSCPKASSRKTLKLECECLNDRLKELTIEKRHLCEWVNESSCTKKALWVLHKDWNKGNNGNFNQSTVILL